MEIPLPSAIAVAEAVPEPALAKLITASHARTPPIAHIVNPAFFNTLSPQKLPSKIVDIAKGLSFSCLE